jgi:hypothetical protein
MSSKEKIEQENINLFIMKALYGKKIREKAREIVDKCYIAE